MNKRWIFITTCTEGGGKSRKGSGLCALSVCCYILDCLLLVFTSLLIFEILKYSKLLTDCLQDRGKWTPWLLFFQLELCPPTNNLPRVSPQHTPATSSRECRECWSLVLGLGSTTSTTPSSIINVRTLRIQPLCDQILFREVKEHRDLRYGFKRKACKVDGYLRTGRKWGKSIRSNARTDSRSTLEL